MMQAYSGQCEGQLGQHIVRDAFLVALNDPALQIKVREREPRTLKEAVTLASRIEIAQEAAGASPTSRRRMARKIEDCELEHPPVRGDMSQPPRQEVREKTQTVNEVTEHSRSSPPRSGGRQVNANSPKKRRAHAMSQADNHQVSELLKALQNLQDNQKRDREEMVAQVGAIRDEVESYERSTRPVNQSV